MNALKCDRCGKLYESYFLTDAFTKNLSDKYRFYKIEKQMIPDTFSHYLDLCPECQEKLNKWIEGENK